MNDKNFILNLTHDLKTPMNSIIGYTDLALSIEKNDKVKEYLSKISMASDHMMSLVNSILSLNEMEDGKLKIKKEFCSLKCIIKEVNNLLENQLNKKNITFNINYDMLLNDIINIDKLKLKQVLINLLSNAIKYSHNKSEITLIIKEKIINKEFSEFTFIIKDKGIGMSKEFLEKAFERYSRSNEVDSIEGNGLGLSITKEIIEEMKGNINIVSEINKGTEVKFKVTVNIKNRRILIVEDDDLNRDLIKEILNSENYYYEEAFNGKQAYEKILKNDINYYNIILMDINIPFISGIECAELIRNINDKRSKIPIIIMSGNETKDEYIKYEINDFIEKPIMYKKLLEMISKHIN